MVRLLSERLQTSRVVHGAAGATVEVQGQATLVGDEHVQLTGARPACSLPCGRNGVVVSPTTLLRTVWGGASADEHVVGVTVGRLAAQARRLRRSVRTVPRRGYRLEVSTKR